MSLSVCHAIKIPKDLSIEILSRDQAIHVSSTFETTRDWIIRDQNHASTKWEAQECIRIAFLASQSMQCVVVKILGFKETDNHSSKESPKAKPHHYD